MTAFLYFDDNAIGYFISFAKMRYRESGSDKSEHKVGHKELKVQRFQN